LRVQYMFIIKIEMAIEYLRTNTTNTKRAATDHKKHEFKLEIAGKKIKLDIETFTLW